MNKNTSKRRIIAAIAALAFAVTLPAETKYWNNTSPASGNWANPTWFTSPDGSTGGTTFASGTDSAVITRSNVVISFANIGTSNLPTALGLEIRDGARFTTGTSGSQSLTLTGAGSGNLEWNGTTAGYFRLLLGADVAWNGKITETSTAASGSANASSSKEIRINSPTATSANTHIALNGTGKLVLNQNTGTVTLGELSGTSSSAEITAINAGGNRAISLVQATDTTYAGTWTRGGREWTFTKDGAGRIRFTGAISAWTTGAQVTGGAVYLNGAVTGLGDVSVSANTTLGGTGDITLASGKTISLANGAILDPGDITDTGIATTGTLTINAADDGGTGAGLVFAKNATIKFNLDGDKIVLTGDSMSGSAAADSIITFDFTASSASVVGTTIDLIAFGATPGIATTSFAASEGWSGNFKYTGNTLQFEVLGAPTAIPEPAANALFLGLGVAAALALFRRRR
jgi:hypothetical protein